MSKPESEHTVDRNTREKLLGVGKFWSWFREHNQDLLLENRTEDTLRFFQMLLDDVAEDLEWEMGPADDGVNRFIAFSPDWRDSTLSEMCRLLVSRAPHVPGWKVRLYKPRRRWDMVFRIRPHGAPLEVDAKKWQVKVVPRSDGLFEVAFKLDESLAEMTDETRRHAALTVLDGELGTLTSRSMVATLDVVDEWTLKEQPTVVPLTVGWLASQIRPRVM